jgi:hypothetical protein
MLVWFPPFENREGWGTLGWDDVSRARGWATRPAVSKMERRTDMYVSTLQDLIKAMGGELKITANFPEGSVEINQFADARKPAAGKS